MKNVVSRLLLLRLLIVAMCGIVSPIYAETSVIPVEVEIDSRQYEEIRANVLEWLSLQRETTATETEVQEADRDAILNESSAPQPAATELATTPAPQEDPAKSSPTPASTIPASSAETSSSEVPATETPATAPATTAQTEQQSATPADAPITQDTAQAVPDSQPDIQPEEATQPVATEATSTASSSTQTPTSQTDTDTDIASAASTPDTSAQTTTDIDSQAADQTTATAATSSTEATPTEATTNEEQQTAQAQSQPIDTEPLPSAQPKIVLDVSPNPASTSEPVTVSWQTEGVDYCFASGAWTGDKDLNGTQTIGPFTDNQRVMLSCGSGASGVVSDVYLVTHMSGEVSVDLFVDQQNIFAGKTATLTWQAENAEGCTADKGWTGDKPLTGQFTSPPLEADTTFQITCFNADSEASAMVSVRTRGPLLQWHPPSTYSDGTPLDIGGYKLYWGDEPQVYDRETTLPADATSWSAALDPGTYYVVLATLDKQGIEGNLSAELALLVE